MYNYEKYRVWASTVRMNIFTNTQDSGTLPTSTDVYPLVYLRILDNIGTHYHMNRKAAIRRAK
jgi:hypothetical protein